MDLSICSASRAPTTHVVRCKAAASRMRTVRTFEVKQSIHDEPLRSDPETGEGARRVISAGYNVLIRGKSVGPCGRLGRFTLSLHSAGLPDYNTRPMESCAVVGP